MKLKTLLLGSLSAFLLLGWLGAPSAVAFDGDDEEESVIHESMETLMGNFMPLRRALGAEDAAAALGHVVAMQGATFAAKGEVPPLAGEQPEADRAAYVRGYRESMIDLMDQLLELERAVLDEDWDTANGILREGLAGIRDAGHQRYKPQRRW